MPVTKPDRGRGRRKTSLNMLAAQRLREAAVLIEEQGDTPFRVRAYRRAAEAVEALDTDLRALLDSGGIGALQDIPGVGESIATSLAEMAATGHWSYLERRRGETSPAALFNAVPGVGSALAQRLHDVLHVDSLEQLEAALSNPDCARVPGLGERRRAALLGHVAQMLARIRVPRMPGPQEPSVDMLLSVDEEYRQKARAGSLRRIAPHRFNPSGEAWLPVLHATRNGWHFTALYSNTARAHELGRTHDWVVIYFHAAKGAQAQRTVVTQPPGALAGKRVVRGREADCRLYHSRGSPPDRRRNGTDH
ncbi:MAG: helix-hairpin-helix domain-containing protein [Phycisphaerae bacterium]